jgi:glycosyltransferase involved in cell wall biosynthesis
MKKLLVVCFTFPPYPGIGGRRWAKFVKYLDRKGVDCTVVAARKTNTGNSNWCNDIKGYKSKIHYIKSPYPSALMMVPKNIFSKLHYRLALYYVRLRYSNQNYYDHSIGFGNSIYRFVENAIQSGTKNILISVGPFQMAWELLTLKKKYPEINFMVDFRDPWSNNKTSFGFAEMHSGALENEQNKEKSVIKACDCVISVSEEMNDYFKTTTAENHSKFYVIPNGFDPEDFVDFKDEKPRKESSINLLLLGTLYNKTRTIFAELNDALHRLKTENPGGYNKLRFHFCGEVPDWFHEFQNQHNIIFYDGIKQQKEAFELAARSDAMMLFLTDDLNFSMSTKFYEAIAMKKPLVVFSDKGKTAEYVEENNIGKPINKGNIYKDLTDFIAMFENKRVKFNPEFNTADFNIELLSEKVIRLLN